MKYIRPLPQSPSLRGCRNGPSPDELQQPGYIAALAIVCKFPGLSTAANRAAQRCYDLNKDSLKRYVTVANFNSCVDELPRV